jgi:TonB-linked SusC/RagA family outer membrane protein
MRIPWIVGTVAAVGELVCGTEPLTSQERRSVSGRVTNTAGVPLSGAYVSVPSLSASAATRADGSYAIPLPASPVPAAPITVTARLIGYKRDSLGVTLRGGFATADFALEANPLHLGELVVTGAGTETEVEKLGTVRDRIDPALVVRSNEQNLVNALAAKAPNLLVWSSSGDPGASSHIQIRGLTSIASSDGQPLFVIDGVPVDNTTLSTGNGSAVLDPNRLIDINPSDIEKIELLKGAASGAIYGSSAGQGVVLITTKKGRAGQTSYSLRSSWSLEEHTQLPRLQTEYGLGTGGEASPCVASHDPALLNCFVTGPFARSYGPKLAPGTPVYDHLEEAFQTGYTTDNTLTVSGGSEQTQFLLSAGYSYNRGIVVGNGNSLRRISVRVNGAHRISDALKAGINMAHTDAGGRFVQTRNNTAGILIGAWRTPPEFNNLPYLDPTFGLHRSYRFPNPGPGSENTNRGFDNPFFAAHESPASTDVPRTFGNLDLQWTPMGWLSVRETLGLDYWRDVLDKAWAPSGTGFGLSDGAVVYDYVRHRRIDHNLTATATWGGSGSVRGAVTLGQNLNARSRRGYNAFGAQLIAPEPYNLNNTAELQSSDHTEKLRLESYFAQVTTDIGDRVFLSAALRNDGVSAFGADRRRAWFPKGSAAWVFTRQGRGGFLSYGKIRAAYGQSGTQPPPYLTGSGYEPFGQGALFTSQRRPNRTLGPERVKEFEAGVDLGFFGDKADLSVTHYRQNSTDVIVEVPLPTSSGYFHEPANAASLQNRGWEVALNLRPFTRRGFAWDVGVQWARNRGVTTALAGDIRLVPFPYTGGSDGAGAAIGVAMVGEPIGVYYGTDYVRCGRGSIVNEVDLDNAPGHCHGAPAGALYLGADGLPFIDHDEQYVLGDPNPAWTGSVRTDVRIGRLSIGGLLDVVHGSVAANSTQGALNEFGTGLNTALGRNAPPVVFGTNYYPGLEPTPVAGPGVGIPVKLDEGWWRGGGSVFAGIGSLFIEKGGWVKLREVSIAYTLDGPWVGRVLGFASIELRVAGRNLVSWNDYTGVDPETSLVGAVTPIRGLNYFNNPQTRSWVLAVTLNR